jgi:hypothetical protein
VICNGTQAAVLYSRRKVEEGMSMCVLEPLEVISLSLSLTTNLGLCSDHRLDRHLIRHVIVALLRLVMGVEE